MKKKHRFWAILLAGSLLAFMALSAQVSAQRDDGPPTHNFGGTWSLRQSNGYVVTMVLTQNVRDISGTSSYNSGRKGIVRCTVNGKAWHQKGANGWPSYFDHFQVEVVCNGAVAVYNASASWAEGILNGKTYPKDKPSGSATWTAGPFARRR